MFKVVSSKSFTKFKDTTNTCLNISSSQFLAEKQQISLLGYPKQPTEKLSLSLDQRSRK